MKRIQWASKADGAQGRAGLGKANQQLRSALGAKSSRRISHISARGLPPQFTGRSLGVDETAGRRPLSIMQQTADSRPSGRALEQYLAELVDEFDRLPLTHRRRPDLARRIRAVEAEIDARQPL